MLAGSCQVRKLWRLVMGFTMEQLLKNILLSMEMENW